MQKKLIGIIGGKGQMGKYFADFFKKNGYKVIISDCKTKLSNIELAAKADVVVISVPIDATKRVIEKVVPHVRKDALLMDLTSLKVMPMKAMAKTKASYLGCHPMFGPTNSIQGRIVILCKGRGGKWYKWWKSLLETNKANVQEINPKKHDKMMAYVQILSNFTDFVLADALLKSGVKISEFLKYQSPAYRLKLDLMGRILNQDPNLYAQIQFQNPDGLKVAESFLASMQDLIKIVGKKDTKAFVRQFKKASNYFGNYKRLAMKESDYLIDKMNLKETFYR